MDCCLAAQWDVGWRVKVQRCSDGASHSRRVFAGGRILAVPYEMERNGAGVSIGRGSRPSVGLRVRQSLQDWSVGRAGTQGSHLRWLPWARIEIPFRD